MRPAKMNQLSSKGAHEGKITSSIIFMNLTPPYKNAMFRFTAMRIRYYVSTEDLHMPSDSF